MSQYTSRHQSVKPIQRKMSSLKKQQKDSYGQMSTSPRARKQSSVEQSSILPDLARMDYELDIERSYDAKNGRTISSNTKVFNDGIALMKIEQERLLKLKLL